VRSINIPDDPGFARFRFDAAREFPATATQLVVSGQIGDPRDPMPAQIEGALDALLAVLAQAGYERTDIARLGIYTTDIDAFVEAWPVLQARFEPDAVPPNTLLPVGRLVRPGALVEIDALAAR
jgi:enamine deaminase RidA (YjgF/YER057c/UK114 family)